MKKLMFITAVLALSACTKLTQQNYDKLAVGMSTAEVNTIIGKPDSCSTTLGTKICIWGEEKGTYIKVSFVADNAVTFSNNDITQ